MRKLLARLAIFFILTFYTISIPAENPQYWNVGDYLAVTRVFTGDYPEIHFQLQALYHGNPLSRWNPNITKNIQIRRNGLAYPTTTTQHSFNPLPLKVNALLYLKEFNEAELNKIQAFFQPIKSSITLSFFVPTPTGFRDVPFKALYNTTFYTEQDTVIAGKFANYFDSTKPQNEANQIDLIIGDLSKIRHPEILNSKFAKMTSTPGRWYALLYKDFGDILPDMKNQQILSRCLFISSFLNPPENIRNKLQDAFDLLLNSTVSGKFTVRNVIPGDTVREFYLSIPIETDTLRSRFTVRLSGDKMKTYFVQQHLAGNRKILEQANFTAAMDSLIMAFRSFPADSFLAAGGKIMQKWRDLILMDSSYQQIPQWIQYAGSSFSASLKNASWYLPSLKQLLKVYSGFLATEQADLAEQLKVCEQVLKLEPGNKTFLLKRLRLKARQSESLGRVREAAKWYRQAWERHRNRASKTKFLKIVTGLMENAFQKGQYQQLSAIAKDYFPYIKNRFKFRYYLAVSSQKSGFTREAKSHYEWLLKHWKNNQKYLAWDETFKNLQGLYLATMEFDKAFDLLKQIYRGNTSIDSRLSLLIFNLRAKYLVPFLDISAILFNQANGARLGRAMLQEMKPGLWPRYLNGMMLLSDAGATIAEASKVKTVTPPGIAELNSIRQFPDFLSRRKRKITYLVQRIPEGYFVLQINNAISEEEKLFLNAIQQNPLEDKPWFNLYVYEHRQGIPALVQLMSITLGIDYMSDGRLNLDEYWKVLKKNKFTRYMALYSTKGHLQKAINFNLKKADFDSIAYKRSTQTAAIYLQQISYNGRKTLDVSNPFYRGTQFGGVIRFGFINY